MQSCGYVLALCRDDSAHVAVIDTQGEGASAVWMANHIIDFQYGSSNRPLSLKHPESAHSSRSHSEDTVISNRRYVKTCCFSRWQLGNQREKCTATPTDTVEPPSGRKMNEWHLFFCLVRDEQKDQLPWGLKSNSEEELEEQRAEPAPLCCTTLQRMTVIFYFLLAPTD